MCVRPSFLCCSHRPWKVGGDLRGIGPDIPTQLHNPHQQIEALNSAKLYNTDFSKFILGLASAPPVLMLPLHPDYLSPSDHGSILRICLCACPFLHGFSMQPSHTPGNLGSSHFLDFTLLGLSVPSDSWLSSGPLQRPLPMLPPSA